MSQLRHNPKTMDELYGLNIKMSELLDVFVNNHPEFTYTIDMYIGKEDHNINITVIDNSNAETITGLS